MTDAPPDEYVIRRFQPGDEDDFLDLYHDVWGHRRDRDWFVWRFERVPYVDHVPMFVAERDGTVVGTRPFLAFPLHVGRDRSLALLTVDTMVHPDHRRNGLFTCMTERAVEFYADRDPAFCFNQPTADALAGFRKLGWDPVAPTETHYRVQSPSALVAGRTDRPAARALARAADAGANGYLRARDALATRPSLDVTSEPGVATGALADLHRSADPAGIHAVRDRTFLDWRFDSPEWDRHTYLARDGDRPVAGLLVRTRTVDDRVRLAQIADVAPLDAPDRRRDALHALLGAVVADHDDADLLAAPGRSLPDDALSAYGFHSDQRPPLARFRGGDCRLAVRPLGDRTPGVDLHDPGNWRLTFAERDTT